MTEELLLYEGRNKAAEVRLTLVFPRPGFLVGFILQASNFPLFLIYS